MEEVDICIPAYNEELVILPTITTILAACDSFLEYTYKITVIDNNSTDATAALVEKHADPRVRLLKQPISGKGAAVSLAASQSRSDILLYIDADLSADPKHIIELLHKIKNGADIAVGSRLLKSENVNRSLWRTFTANVFKAYASLLVPVTVSDSQCGLKVMNTRGREILASCEEHGWFFDREFLAKANKRKLTIVEVPVEWEEFRYPNRKSKLHVLKAGLNSLYSLWRIRKIVNSY